MKKLSGADKLTDEITILNRKRKQLVVDSPMWKSNKSKVDKLSAKLIVLKHDERTKPLVSVKGQSIFHVLTREDMAAIFELAGTSKPLSRAIMVTAKYCVKRPDKLKIYFDVFPSGIIYCTMK